MSSSHYLFSEQVTESCPSTFVIHATSELPYRVQKTQSGQTFRKPDITKEICSLFQTTLPQTFWVGWTGIELEDNEQNVFRVQIDRSLINDYQEFCRDALLPFFNLMQGKISFDHNKWKVYDEVNIIFSNRIWDACKIRNVKVLVWIHGFELMMVPHWLRQRLGDERQRCKIGFRFHSGFPAWYVFRLLPKADEVLQGILACDVVGFETPTDSLNFMECCKRCLGCRVDTVRLLVEHGERTVRIKCFPIVQDFYYLSEQAKALPTILHKNKQVILSITQLDYVRETVLAFKAVLSKLSNVTMNLVVLSGELPKSTEELIHRINIKFVQNLEDQNELISLYKDADVCLIVSAGLSRYAKEFLACQVNSPPGVLMVSSSSHLPEIMPEALQFNPLDASSFAENLQRALEMSEDERCVRMGLMRKREERHDFVSLEDMITEVLISKTTVNDFEDLSKFIGEKKIALLLDYDGTLSPIAPHPDLAILPSDTKRILELLRDHRDCFISIISGRNIKNVEDMVGIGNIVYAGNHGLAISFLDGSSYIHPMPKDTEQKILALQKALEREVCKPGAWVENKTTALTFHFRKVEESMHSELEEKAKHLIEKAGFRTGRAHCAVEAKPLVNWNKGRAALYILKKVFGEDWYDQAAVFYVGDDVTDEDAIRVLKGLGTTYRVVSSTLTRTSADRRLTSTEDVTTLLKWVEQFLRKRAKTV